jgi:glycerol-3-phosphate acyltransferase PlsY
LNPWLGLATLATWLIIAVFTRYSSLAAVVSAAFAPFYQLLIWGGGPTAVAVMVMGGLLIWRHRKNIQKLLKGTESKLSLGAASASVPGAPQVRPSKHSRHTHKHGVKS